MTDSDWIEFENQIRVTWYYYPELREKRIPRNQNYNKPLFSETHCHSCNRIASDVPILWIEQKMDRGVCNSIFICEKCFKRVEKLIKMLKEMPKSERYFDRELAKKNEEQSKLPGMHILLDPHGWRTPDIQRRFSEEEL